MTLTITINATGWLCSDDAPLTGDPTDAAKGCNGNSTWSSGAASAAQGAAAPAQAPAGGFCGEAEGSGDADDSDIEELQLPVHARYAAPMRSAHGVRGGGASLGWLASGRLTDHATSCAIEVGWLTLRPAGHLLTSRQLAGSD